jgi:hypothetical protein
MGKIANISTNTAIQRVRVKVESFVNFSIAIVIPAIAFFRCKGIAGDF